MPHHLSGAIHKIFHTSDKQLRFATKPKLCLRLMVRAPDSATCFCVYPFTHSFGTAYVDRKTSRLSKRIREHHPAWLNAEATKTTTSAEFSHRVNVVEAYRPKSKVSSRHSRRGSCGHSILRSVIMGSETICSSTKVPIVLSYLAKREQSSEWSKSHVCTFFFFPHLTNSLRSSIPFPHPS